MWFKLTLFVCLMVSVNSTNNYFETFFVEPEPSGMAEVPTRNALRFEAFKWPRAEVPFMFDESSYGNIGFCRLITFNITN